MASIKVKLKKPYKHYGKPKRPGDEILIDPSQQRKMIRQGFIEDPTLKTKKAEVNDG